MSGGFTKCPGSQKVQMLAWMPDDSKYPGAVVCLRCSFGVLVTKGSAHEATSMTGFEGMAGKVRTHYVNQAKGAMRYRK